MKTALSAALVLTLGFVAQPSASAQGAVPRAAGTFTATAPSGKPLVTPSYKGKVTVLQFLSVGCPHCQKFSQLLTKFQADPALKGFQAMGIAFDNGITGDLTATYIKNFNIGIPVGYADKLKVFNYLGLSIMDNVGVPQIVVIDGKGQVRAQTSVEGGGKLGDEAYLRSYLASLLKEGPTGSGKATPAPSAKSKTATKDKS